MFRVRAQNQAGVGKTSDVTEPVTAVTKPGERKRRANKKEPSSEPLITDLCWFSRHHRDRGGCGRRRRHITQLRLLQHDSGLQVCLVQELRGDHRLQPRDHGDQGKQVSLGSDTFLKKKKVLVTQRLSLLLRNWFPTGPKWFSTARRRRMSVFTPVWSPTLTELHPATRSLRKVGTKAQRKTAAV